MKKIIISDVTLRDGNHAVNHQISEDVIKKYCIFAEQSKIPIIEVGHGNGIGASSLSVGIAKLSDKKLLNIARKILKKTKLSVHSIPGFSKFDDLKLAIDSGVDIIRVGCNSSDIDIIVKQIEFCKKNNVECWGVLMMFHMILKENKYVKSIKFLKDLGLKNVIIMDSAGYLLPDDVKKIITKITNLFKINIGFHAHNNLGYAIGNSIEAIKSGANIIDVSMNGFGAGAGNAQLEIFLTILKRMNIFNKINLEKVYEMSEEFEKMIKKTNPGYKNPFSTGPNILSATNGLFSGFASQVSFFCKEYGVSKLKAFKEIGKKQLVAGQEDLIMNVIFNLKNKI